MADINKYLTDGKIQRSKIAVDVANGNLTSGDIKNLCNDDKVKSAFIGNTFYNKVPKDRWNQDYLDEIVCVAVAENFNMDYLLYLAEVGEYVRNKRKAESNGSKKTIIGIVIGVVIVVAVIGFII
jgi:hypothetical protein